MSTRYTDKTGLAYVVKKLKAYVAGITYSYYIDETTGNFVAVNTAGATSPDMTLDETTGNVTITT